MNHEAAPMRLPRDDIFQSFFLSAFKHAVELDRERDDDTAAWSLAFALRNLDLFLDQGNVCVEIVIGTRKDLLMGV